MPGSGIVKPRKRLRDPGTWGRKVRIKTGGAPGSPTPPPPPGPALSFPLLFARYQVRVIALHIFTSQDPFLCSPCPVFLLSKAQNAAAISARLPSSASLPSLLCARAQTDCPQFLPFVLELSSPEESPLFWAQTTARLSKAWDWGPLNGSLENAGI